VTTLGETGGPICVGLWGQSQMVFPGEDLTERITTSPFGPLGLVSLTRWSNGTWHRLDDLAGPTYGGQPSERVSPWPSMAGSIMFYTRRPLYVSAQASGNTCLVANPPRNWDPVVGTYYAAALAALEDMPNLAAVLFDQGQCDRANGVPASTWLSALYELADAVWAAKGVPILLAQDDDLAQCYGGTGEFGLAAYRAAQQQAIAHHPHIHAGPDEEGMRLNSCASAHIAAVRDLGARWSSALRLYLHTR
jgi:hypothetical protein